MMVRVVRPCYFGGTLKSPGDVFDLRDDFAREAIGTGRVARETPAPPVAGPMTTETTETLVAGKRRKTGE